MTVPPIAAQAAAANSGATSPVKAHQRRKPGTAKKLDGAAKLYALIDEATRDAAGQDVGDLIILDTIDKAMADAALKSLPKRGSPVGAFAAGSFDWQPRVFTIQKSALTQSFPSATRGEWFELTPSTPGRNALRLTAVDLGTPSDAEAEQGNDAESDVYVLPRSVPVARTKVAKLDRLAMLEGVNVAPVDGSLQSIVGVWPTAASALRVAVYDVGQANCNAVIRANGRPLIYFDMGWPWSSTAAPVQVPNLLRGNRAPVVLSHWDFDHWAFALQSRGRGGKGVVVKPEALERNWIARKPELKAHRLGPTHIAFAIALLKVGKLLLWPDATKTLDATGLRLIACKPKGAALSDRNNTGLAMRVQHVGDTGLGDVLLTGDADYASISNADSTALDGLTGLVVPHHGGATITSPPVPALLHSPAVISAHERNTYGHPKAAVIFGCISAGWGIACTLNRYPNCGGDKLIPNGCLATCAGSPPATCPQRLIGLL